MPTPCGSNAICQERNKAASCQCIPEYFGDPYVACRPECVVNSDCPSNKACQRNKCVDPCPGTCGINAQCDVRNHVPTCTCLEGYIGDPFVECRRKPLSKFDSCMLDVLFWKFEAYTACLLTYFDLSRFLFDFNTKHVNSSVMIFLNLFTLLIIIVWCS